MAQQIKWEDVKPGMRIAVYFNAEHLMGIYEAQSEAEIVHGHQAFVGDVSAVYVKVAGQAHSKEFSEGMIVILVEEEIEETKIKATFENFQAQQAAKVALISNALDDVMTTAEVAEEFGIADATVRQAIGHRYVEGRKSGGTWLIRRADAIKRWGLPMREPMRFTYWSGDEEPANPAHNTEWRDSEGNTLRLLESADEDIELIGNEKLNAFLHEFGYDGPGDWELA